MIYSYLDIPLAGFMLIGSDNHPCHVLLPPIAHLVCPVASWLDEFDFRYSKYLANFSTSLYFFFLVSYLHFFKQARIGRL